MTNKNKQEEIYNAFQTIKQAMIEDNPEEQGSYAHSWHCNIAMAFYDSILNNDSCLAINRDWAHDVSNNAASIFMKRCFDVETKK